MAIQASQNNTPVQKEKEINVVVKVGQMIDNYVNNRTLHLPSDYSVENALKSAWLALQEVQDRNGNPALKVCSQPSIINALLDMCVQGLNPAKKQLYFIVYGTSLTCQRSYFGDQALAKRVKPGVEIYSAVVYKDDVFEFGFLRGRKVITKHETKLANVDSSKIVAAYCGVVSESGEDLGAEIMTMEQIRKSWGKSKVYSPGKGTHAEFPEEMAKRTVIRKRCKPIINDSNDALLLEAVRRQDIDTTEAEIDAEAGKHANGQIINMPGLVETPASGPAEAEDKDEKVPDAEYVALDAVQLKALLKINDDQWTYTKDQLAEKGDVSIEDFLNGCVREGCKDYKAVSKQLEKVQPVEAAKEALPF